jgi:hypothetical protein
MSVLSYESKEQDWQVLLKRPLKGWRKKNQVQLELQIEIHIARKEMIWGAFATTILIPH